MNKNVKKFGDANKIQAEINTLKKSLLNLKFQKTTGQLEKTSDIKKTRKKIARLYFNLNQNKELNNA